MFPFNLPGPEFLVFYALFAVVVIAVVHLGRRHLETGQLPSADLVDPFLFACLRGGPKEVVAVATMGLLDRGLLHADGSRLARAAEAKPELVRRQVEKELLRRFEHPTEFRPIRDDATLVRIAAEEYEEPLRRLQLVPDDNALRTRFLLLMAAITALLGVGGIKLAIALGAGRSNVLFLIVMMLVAVVVAFRIRGAYRTATGERYLESVRDMFAGLRERASSIRPGSGSRELLWLTALYGAAAVPTAAFPFVPYLWPRPANAASCGSTSCGSSGGGCGGGGGGCGGCGS